MVCGVHHARLRKSRCSPLTSEIEVKWLSELSQPSPVQSRSASHESTEHCPRLYLSMLAGSVPPPTAAKAKPVKKDRVKLHPSNSMVVQTLVVLSNCCNFEEDHSASARLVLRRGFGGRENKRNRTLPPGFAPARPRRIRRSSRWILRK